MVLSVLLITGDYVTHIGSGFVSNSNGLFLTASHVVKLHLNEIHRLRIAFPEIENPSPLYRIKVLYSEYQDPLVTRTGINKKSFHQDLAICRILSYDYSSYLQIQTKRPSQDEFLTINGFYNPDKVSVPIIKNTVNLSFLKIEETQFRIKHRLFSIFSGNSNDYELSPDRVAHGKIFNNCLTLLNSAHPGVSGAPVLNSDNKVVGILLGGNQNLHYCNVLCSKYIRKQYKFIT